MNKGKNINPFSIPNIIQNLAFPKINRDNHLLFRNLRQLSTLHHQILSPKYFDTIQLTMEIDKWSNRILYGRPDSAADMKLLRPEIWDPITCAPTIRKLFLTGTELDYILPSSNYTGNIASCFNPLELISQISPYVTTLGLDMEEPELFDDDELPTFLQQFVSLKKLQLNIGKTGLDYWIEVNLDFLEPVLMKIDEISGEFEVELILRSVYPNVRLVENILSIERAFMTKNHKFSLKINVSVDSWENREIEDLARVLTEASENSVPVKELFVHLSVDHGHSEKEKILNNLFILSPYVESLLIWEPFEELDNLIFTSYYWSRLKKLTIIKPKVNLIGLSNCPNLEELELRVPESTSFFTNSEITDEENLHKIFGDCPSTLQILKFNSFGPVEEIRKLIPGSKLLKYLQDLLPNTLIEVEPL